MPSSLCSNFPLPDKIKTLDKTNTYIRCCPSKTLPQMNKSRHFFQTHPDHTHPLIWCIAVICAILAVAVIIGGIAISAGYMVIHPRVPFISVVAARLDTFQFDSAGLLETRVLIAIRATNDNARAHATFQDTSLMLSFVGQDVANLTAATFDVKKNYSVDLNYEVESSPIPLDPKKMELVNMGLRKDVIVFDLKGDTRARWRVGPFGSVKFWCHLNCKLNFHPLNLSHVDYPSCTSRSK